MKALGIAGYSGSGKTTLIEGLLPRLAAAGLTLGVLKQSHHDFEVDKPGKDSWRHRRAGARQVLLTSPHRWMLVEELAGGAEPDLNAHLARLSTCDLVLVEGCKHADLPKIEVWRAANGKPWLYPEDGRFIAVVADQLPHANLPCFHLDDLPGVTAFILRWLRP